MFISDLALTDYRSYENLVISFPQGINILVGENGQGKTNLIEAIVYLSTFNSHRIKNDNTLIRYDKEKKQNTTGAIIRAKKQEKNNTTLIELELIQGKPNRARINKNNIKNKEILGHIKTIIFSPEDLQLIKSEPNYRRNFIDELITQIQPTYMGVRTEMEKVLKQRNAVLKQTQYEKKINKKTDFTMLQIWDEKLAELCAKTLKKREKIIEELKKPVKETYKKVSADHKKLTLEYKNNSEKYGIKIDPTKPEKEIKQQYLELIEKNREKEIERGINLIGTHRDDIEFYLDEMPVKSYASHGETWSVALAIKIGAYESIKNLFEEDPILILDDVFAELDNNRRKSLVEIIENTEQVFITAAVNEDIPKEIKATKYYVKNLEGITHINTENFGSENNG